MRNGLSCAPASSRQFSSLFSPFGTFDHLFENVLGNQRASGSGTMTPPIDLNETTDAYTVVMDVPGFTIDQINVQFSENVLTLSAEQPEATKGGDDTRWHFVERVRGSFSRGIKFPVPVDGTAVKATMKNGVLTVTVPKAAAARTQKIKILES